MKFKPISVLVPYIYITGFPLAMTVLVFIRPRTKIWRMTRTRVFR